MAYRSTINYNGRNETFNNILDTYDFLFAVYRAYIDKH